MRRLAGHILAAVALIFGAATLFFTWFGVQIVYAAVTFDGEGSLGTVGLYIAAVLYPLLAVISGGITWSARRAALRRLRGTI